MKPDNNLETYEEFDEDKFMVEVLSDNKKKEE